MRCDEKGLNAKYNIKTKHSKLPDVSMTKKIFESAQFWLEERRHMIAALWAPNGGDIPNYLMFRFLQRNLSLFNCLHCPLHAIRNNSFRHTHSDIRKKCNVLVLDDGEDIFCASIESHVCQRQRVLFYSASAHRRHLCFWCFFFSRPVALK